MLTVILRSWYRLDVAKFKLNHRKFRGFVNFVCLLGWRLIVVVLSTTSVVCLSEWLLRNLFLGGRWHNYFLVGCLLFLCRRLLLHNVLSAVYLAQRYLLNVRSTYFANWSCFVSLYGVLAGRQFWVVGLLLTVLLWCLRLFLRILVYNLKLRIRLFIFAKLQRIFALNSLRHGLETYRFGLIYVFGWRFVFILRRFRVLTLWWRIALAIFLSSYWVAIFN